MIILYTIIAIFAVLVAFFVYWSARKTKPKMNPKKGELKDKVIIVTGANTGIGFATAKQLAKGSATIYLACRNVKKAEIARDQIIEITNNKNIHVLQLDLSDSKSTIKAAQEFLSKDLKLDILVNNAGVVPVSFTTATATEVELTWAVNHFNHFLFVRLILDKMIETGKANKNDKSRIVIVNSGSHRMANSLCKSEKKSKDLEVFSNYVRSKDCFSTVMTRTYAETKLASLLTYKYLSHLLVDNNLDEYININIVNPGPVNTDISRNAPVYINWLVKFIMKNTFKTPECGADTSIYAAIHDDIKNSNGLYYDDCKLCEPLKIANDKDEQHKFYNYSCQLLNLPTSIDSDLPDLDQYGLFD
eukprot:TRINITY_DN1066_c0_g1_i1.p1 TRINITY_DN1066_c0_g1~~TRINITY_DN1066_c0_g1_i1.p1  ORF type:complete len:360 (+),score=84.76 TRINITY_DN1066_c0_g1_i1:40-1119(+)